MKQALTDCLYAIFTGQMTFCSLSMHV